MPTTTNDGIELAYQVSGEGPPLLIISGLSAERSFWNLSRPLLSGFTLIEFDNRDIGKSGRAKAAYAAADMARDALAVLDAVGVARAHVVGHSLGGAIAQELTLMAPKRVDRLVLSNTFARNDLYTTEIMRLLKELRLQLDDELTFGAALTTFVLGMRTLKSVPLFASVQQALDAGLYQEKDAFLRQLDACVKVDTLARLGHIASPTFVLYCDDDRLFSPALVREVANAIPGAALDEILDSGHCPMVEAPQNFATSVRAFLNGS
ncbi:alpha/beta hydrolase [Xanthobacter dioxanivorans]|uniref:Alpha/beta hydrolase n=1 Tax=Xanthobacter dioxanivorans TaxID=2528964 RepID=A0A974PQC3_9HYPH|nr:alpha/beta hydrolase [Xanthobacter dioxanivorans]QRG07812.1 alpha/beta hydrolase [Xanthobacter dioxanivorans]